MEEKPSVFKLWEIMHNAWAQNTLKLFLGFAFLFYLLNLLIVELFLRESAEKDIVLSHRFVNFRAMCFLPSHIFKQRKENSRYEKVKHLNKPPLKQQEQNSYKVHFVILRQVIGLKDML